MRTIDYDSIVETADGTICRVGYVDRTRLEAYVKPIEGDREGDELTLPLSELTRIKDPCNQLPPIEGMPTKRPTCQYCGKKLDPSCDYSYSPTNRPILSPRVSRRVFERWKGYGRSTETYTVSGEAFYVPLFHSTKCAMAFAQASWNGGMRMPKK